MICQYCDSEYQRMAGVPQPRKDYGYCSVKCLEDSKEPCPGCGALIKHREDEPLSEFARRCYCSQRCAASHLGKRPKSDEAKRRMSDAAKNRSPEYRSRLSEARIRFLSTDAGKRLIAHRKQCYQQWRQDNPIAVAETIRRQDASRRKRGVYRATSERLKAFYKTPEGQARKEQYRQLYIGKKRPPRVTEKMRQSLRKFWDSPQGLVLREEISIQRTNGERFAPFGPGWRQKTAKIRQRDGKTCAICGNAKEENGRILDVHHIYPRRLFGYIPGENRNYVWANHPANLITLCRRCHLKAETDNTIIPSEHQQRADALWHVFIAL